MLIRKNVLREMVTDNNDADFSALSWITRIYTRRQPIHSFINNHIKQRKIVHTKVYKLRQAA